MVYKVKKEERSSWLLKGGSQRASDASAIEC